VNTTLTRPIDLEMDEAIIDLVQAVTIRQEITATQEYLIIPRAALTPAAQRLGTYLERVMGESLPSPIVHAALWDWLVNEVDTTVGSADSLATVPDAAPDLMAYLQTARILAARPAAP
jgi:hypothetical protein